MTRSELPAHADHIFTGDAWDWIPPRRFDYVRTELVYVPDDLHAGYLHRILDAYLNPGGRLLVAEYRGRQIPADQPSIDNYLAKLGFAVDSFETGRWDGLELTRIALVSRATHEQFRLYAETSGPGRFVAQAFRPSTPHSIAPNPETNGVNA